MFYHKHYDEIFFILNPSKKYLSSWKILETKIKNHKSYYVFSNPSLGEHSLALVCYCLSEGDGSYL